MLAWQACTPMSRGVCHNLPNKATVPDTPPPPAVSGSVSPAYGCCVLVLSVAELHAAAPLVRFYVQDCTSQWGMSSFSFLIPCCQNRRLGRGTRLAALIRAGATRRCTTRLTTTTAAATTVTTVQRRCERMLGRARRKLARRKFADQSKRETTADIG